LKGEQEVTIEDGLTRMISKNTIGNSPMVAGDARYIILTIPDHSFHVRNWLDKLQRDRRLGRRVLGTDL
jgi:hypothetical protein